MSQFYIDPSRESDPHALPDAEVFWSWGPELAGNHEEPLEKGYYWWTCFPGCLPDGDPVGPFETEAKAIADAREES